MLSDMRNYCRELSLAKEVVVAQRWMAARWQLVSWFCCCCVTIVISFWWFGLGVVVGATGFIGAVTGMLDCHLAYRSVFSWLQYQVRWMLSRQGQMHQLLL